MIAVIDNYDSFVHNLARYLRRLGQRTEVFRNDAVTIDDLRALHPEAIVISPGPCTPTDAGISLDIVETLHRDFPILGVCLGHQAIGQAFGAAIVQSAPVHGRASAVSHDGQHEFSCLPAQFEAGRYHSLVIAPESVPKCLAVSAWTDDRTIMAVRHRQYPIYGWQFHPESVLTPLGHRLLEQFLTDVQSRKANPLPISHLRLHPVSHPKRAS